MIQLEARDGRVAAVRSQDSDMIRGQFSFALPDGGELVIPNHFTQFGRRLLLGAAFGHEFLGALQCGFCAANQVDYIGLTEIGEPTDGVNGYTRSIVPGNPVNWPVLSFINNETYIESRPMNFSAVASPWDKEVNRMFLVSNTDVVAISTPIPGGLQQINNTYAYLTGIKYRLFLR